jgi:hypothetical protein
MKNSLSPVDISTLHIHCRDILVRNMLYTNEPLYILADTDSPLSQYIADAYIAVCTVLSPSVRIRYFVASESEDIKNELI